jgi:hypothetical protein
LDFPEKEKEMQLQLRSKVAKMMCNCGKPTEIRGDGYEYLMCYDCWWAQDPRNTKKEGIEDMGNSLYPDNYEESRKEYEKDSATGPCPGLPAPAFSLNNRLVLEPYLKEGLKTVENKGFAMVSQKVAVKGLRVLMDAELNVGNQQTYRTVRKGDMAYVKEELLHTQPWAAKILECEAIDGKFIIVDLMYVDFVVPK